MESTFSRWLWAFFFCGFPITVPVVFVVSSWGGVLVARDDVQHYLLFRRPGELPPVFQFGPWGLQDTSTVGVGHEEMVCGNDKNKVLAQVTMWMFPLRVNMVTWQPQRVLDPFMLMLEVSKVKYHLFSSIELILMPLNSNYAVIFCWLHLTCQVLLEVGFLSQNSLLIINVFSPAVNMETSRSVNAVAALVIINLCIGAELHAAGNDAPLHSGLCRSTRVQTDVHTSATFQTCILMQ